jgi:hypothetical protein
MSPDMTHMSHIITFMPSDNYLSEDKTIWDQRVREQYKKIIAHHEFRKAGVVKKILKFLIENELGEKDDIRQKDILEKVIGRGDLSNVSHRVGEMRAKLDIYYRDRPKEVPERGQGQQAGTARRTDSRKKICRGFYKRR